jgi:hypothetical protein
MMRIGVLLTAEDGNRGCGGCQRVKKEGKLPEVIAFEGENERKITRSKEPGSTFMISR